MNEKFKEKKVKFIWLLDKCSDDPRGLAEYTSNILRQYNRLVRILNKEAILDGRKSSKKYTHKSAIKRQSKELIKVSHRLINLSKDLDNIGETYLK